MDSNVVISHEARRTVVFLAGEHDIATRSELAATLAKGIAANGADFVVDLSAVTFISVATLNELIRGRAFLRQHGRELSFRAPSPSASRVLDLCGLAELVEPLSIRSAAAALTG